MKAKLTTLFFLLAAPLLHAQATPGLLSYQGRVTDAAGILIGNTTPANRLVTFKLYSASSGGTALYAESQTVTISGGEFSVLIGIGTGITALPGPSSPGAPIKAISDVVNTGTYTSLYLGVTVDDGTAAVDPEISPRQQMVSGAFALRAKVAESVASGAVTTAMLGSGQVIKDTIAAGVVDSSRITDLSIVAGDIRDNTLTSAKLDTTTIGLWSPVGTSVYRASGNVGIGEANPGFPLNFGTGNGDRISLSGNSGSSYGFGILSSVLQIHSDTSGADIAFGYGSSAAMTETMRVKGNGNVGIGYASPGAKLDVNGVGRFGNDAAKIGFVDVGFYGDGSNIALRAPSAGATYIQGASGTNTWMHIGNTGNVGIGNIGADVKLSVSGGVRAAGAGTSVYPYSGGYSFASPGDTDGGMFSPSDGVITWLANGAEKMRLTHEGRLGIGTTSPSVPLDVVGAISYTMTDNGFNGNNGTTSGNTWTSNDYSGSGAGIELYSMDGVGALPNGRIGVTKVGIRADGWIVTARGFAAYSDRRIKRDAQVSASAKDLAAIEKLKVTNYRMVDPEGGDIGWHKGFIAQEVAEVIPGAVTQSVNFVPDIFAAATAAVYDADKQTLRVSLTKEHGLIAGERVRLHTDGNRQDLTVSAVLSANEFVVDHCEKAPEKAFVYGREVTDFNTLDYNRIYTTSVGAIQELAHKIKAGESENTALKTKQADLEARLSALEKLVTPSR